MTRIDVNNYDIIAKIFIMSRQFFRHLCDNWWPKWIVEIADEITMCAAHVDVFSKSVDAFGQCPKGLQKDTQKLVDEVCCRVTYTNQ